MIVLFSIDDVFAEHRIVEVLPVEGEIQRFAVVKGDSRAILYCRSLKRATPEQIDGFASRARALQGLPHRHLPAIVGAGYEPKRSFFWMCVAAPAGKSLRDVLREAPSDADVATKIGLFSGVASVLQWAAERGVAHFGLSPSQIYVRDSVDLRLDKVMGLGVRAVMDAAPTPPPFEERVYRAPEQLRREDANHRADIYALGMILHEMLAGEPPYAAELAEAGVVDPTSAPHGLVDPILTGVLPSPVIDREDVGALWNAFVFRLIAKLPGLRPATWDRVFEDQKDVIRQVLLEAVKEDEIEREDKSGGVEALKRDLAEINDMPIGTFAALAKRSISTPGPDVSRPVTWRRRAVVVASGVVAFSALAAALVRWPWTPDTTTQSGPAPTGVVSSSVASLVHFAPVASACPTTPGAAPSVEVHVQAGLETRVARSPSKVTPSVVAQAAAPLPAITTPTSDQQERPSLAAARKLWSVQWSVSAALGEKRRSLDE